MNRFRLNRGGFCVAAFYCLVVVFVWVVFLLTTKPENVGLDAIPLYLLAMPWYRINPALFFPAFLLNAFICYLIGTAFDRLWQRLFASERA